jgi:hypothetical protein
VHVESLPHRRGRERLQRTVVQRIGNPDVRVDVRASRAWRDWNGRTATAIS